MKHGYWIQECEGAHWLREIKGTCLDARGSARDQTQARSLVQRMAPQIPVSRTYSNPTGLVHG